MDIDYILRIGVTFAVLIGFGILLRALLFVIAKKVEIKIQEAEIVFRSEDKTISIQPYVHILKGEKGSKLLGIGDSPTSDKKYYSVNIIAPNSSFNSPSERKECIEAFFRTAFYQLFDRKILLYTVATVEGAENFNRTVGGDWLNIVDKCLKVAGCIKREFR